MLLFFKTHIFTSFILSSTGSAEEAWGSDVWPERLWQQHPVSEGTGSVLQGKTQSYFMLCCTTKLLNTGWLFHVLGNTHQWHILFHYTATSGTNWWRDWEGTGTGPVWLPGEEPQRSNHEERRHPHSAQQHQQGRSEASSVSSIMSQSQKHDLCFWYIRIEKVQCLAIPKEKYKKQKHR